MRVGSAGERESQSAYSCTRTRKNQRGSSISQMAYGLYGNEANFILWNLISNVQYRRRMKDGAWNKKNDKKLSVSTYQSYTWHAVNTVNR